MPNYLNNPLRLAYEEYKIFKPLINFNKVINNTYSTITPQKLELRRKATGKKYLYEKMVKKFRNFYHNLLQN
jgi:hypothetical protein